VGDLEIDVSIYLVICRSNVDRDIDLQIPRSRDLQIDLEITTSPDRKIPLYRVGEDSCKSSPLTPPDVPFGIRRFTKRA
jgi:hypothetical protein